MTAPGRDAPDRILFVFLDGVGIGRDEGARNPFVFARERLPSFARLFGGRVPTLDSPRSSGDRSAAFPLDATLETDGTPQSGTGQVAVLTGENAAELFGRHFGPWTPVALRPLVEEKSLLRQAMAAGFTAAFANAYPRGWPGPKGGRRIAAPPLAARGAGLLVRHQEDLASGRAVSSEIVNEGWRERLGHRGIPEIDERTAGEVLSEISRGADLTLYAHYATDAAGHREDMPAAVAALERVDRFLGGLLESLDEGTLLLVASDHGNLEDVTTGHTRNPVLGIARGPGAERMTSMEDIRDVTKLVVDSLLDGRATQVDAKARSAMPPTRPADESERYGDPCEDPGPASRRGRTSLGRRSGSGAGYRPPR